MKVHSDGEPEIACEFCGMTFSSLARLNDHIKKQHDDNY